MGNKYIKVDNEKSILLVVTLGVTSAIKHELPRLLTDGHGRAHTEAGAVVMTSDSLQRHKHADHAALVIAQDHGGSASKVKTQMAHGNVDHKVIVGFSDCT